MIAKLLATKVCILAIVVSGSLAQSINCSEELRATIDQNIQKELFHALDSLIAQSKRKRISNDLLWKEERALSKAIFEGIQDLGKTDPGSKRNIEVSLLNSYPISNGRYLNQIAFYRKNEKEEQSLQTLLTVIAHKGDKNITFSTPLRYYTETWKRKQIGSITYHYRDKIRIERAEKFALKNSQFANRFGKPIQSLRYFMVENYQEILKLLGFDYKESSIGKLRDGYGIVGGEIIFSVMNNEDFSHDLFHYYAETIHDWSVRNWVTEEGLAYSWGNAYYTRKDGEMAEQKELLDILRMHVEQNKEVDLLSLFENNFWTDESGIYDHLAPDYKVGRLISSLICDEVYRKHGMEGINKLLTLGSKPNHFEPFLQSVDQLIGINRNNFNQKISRLIEDYN